ncbi:VOC family protein [Fibrisoma montanum]|uniref:VOC family protein n=1 Tax=Fibrisoma montanum TaxID=2305895 RepID=A0A418MBL9_9BACT|nr:VOC family protein [Fibrisoma montanum]RIV23771.1 VOC family protein [Fibrisoma montanum]
MQTITTFLTFNDQAEEAATLYTAIFPNSTITNVTRYGDGGPGPAGSVQSVIFQLAGQTFIALNGGSHFKFAEGISLFVNCATQDEVDFYWEKLSEGGTEGPCGWLNDRFGVSWQVVPSKLGQFLQDEDPEKAKRAMAAMMTMKKIDIQAIEEAVAEAV